MMTGSVALPLMLAGYVGGACLALVAPSSRAARYITALGAIIGSVAALAVAAQVLVTAQPLVLTVPDVLAAAGGVLLLTRSVPSFSPSSPSAACRRRSTACRIPRRTRGARRCSSSA